MFLFLLLAHRAYSHPEIYLFALCLVRGMGGMPMFCSVWQLCTLEEVDMEVDLEEDMLVMIPDELLRLRRHTTVHPQTGTVAVLFRQMEGMENTLIRQVIDFK
jgi:hypothetical protein